MLAPLEDTSDNALRTLCYKYGADLTFTEMTRFDSLAKQNKSSLAKIAQHDDVPTMIQIIGSKEEALKKFLSQFTPKKGFEGFNINLGCPSPEMIHKGLGAAMIKRISKIQRYIDIVKDAGYSCTLKTRLGMNKIEKERKVYLNLLTGTSADFYIIHARHGGQHYESAADFTVYNDCVATGKTIIANGDITTREHVHELKSIGVSGVMIGRAAVYNPAIFTVLKGGKQVNYEALHKEYLALSKKFHGTEKYQSNVLKRLGNIEHLSKTKEELKHVQG